MPMASYLRSVIAYYIEAGSLLSGFVKYSPNADKRTCYVSARESDKAVLSPPEIEQLRNTHYRYESPQVRNAFIFRLYTGLRFCDVKDLTYGNADYQNKMHNFEQNGEDRAAYGEHCNSVESWMIHTDKLFVKRNERTDILS